MSPLNHRHLLLLLLILGLAGLGLAAAVWWYWRPDLADLQAVRQVVLEGLNRIPSPLYFLAFVILPACGVPLTLFYLTALPVFGHLSPLGGLALARKSVEDQCPEDFEWIIIDGGSSDGTAEMLPSIRRPGVKWLSEPDRGIYEAMNKGLRLATGRRVWFLNAGDRFYDERALWSVSSGHTKVEILFGDAAVEDETGKVLGLRSEVTPHKLPPQLEKDAFRKGMVVSHQAFIPLREIVPEFEASRYAFSADLNWMLQILDKTRTSAYAGILATVQRQGATMANWKTSQWERFLILSRHFGYANAISNHLQIAGRRMRFAVRKGFWR